MFKPHAKTAGWASLSLDKDTVRGAVVQAIAGARPRVAWVGSQPLGEAGAMASLLRAGTIGRNPLVVTLARHHYQIVSLPTLEVPPQEWAAAARWKLKEHVEFATDTAAVDVVPVPGPDRDGPPRALMAVAAPATEIRPLVEMLTRSAANLMAIDIPEMALRNLCALIGDENRAQAMLQVTPEGAELVISYRGYLILSRHIELAGSLSSSSADSTMSAARPGEPGSVDLPTNGAPGSALAVPQLELADPPVRAQVAEPAAERLGLELQRTLDVCERRFGYASLERLHVAPGAHGGSLIESLRRAVLVPIESMDLSTLVDFDSLPELASPAMQSQYLCAIGAALRRPPTESA